MQSGTVTRGQGYERYVQDGHGIGNDGKRKRYVKLEIPM